MLAVRAALGLAPNLTVEQLAVRLGVTAAADRAREILRAYAGGLNSADRAFSDRSQPVYPAAALTLAVKAANAAGAKLKLNRAALKEACGYTPKQLALVTAMLTAALEKQKAAAAVRAGQTGPGGEPATPTAAKRLADEHTGRARQPEPVRKRRRSSDVDFELWKKQILTGGD